MTDSPAPPPAPDGAAPEPPRLVGAALVADYVKRLPAKPGVYRMLDRAGEVLYVGKAKSLKARVGSYARYGGHTQRIARMIAETWAMEFVVTETETEALLLESNLIKRLKPRYNVFFRDDKSFPFILIRGDHPAPQILKHRGARAVEGDYYGPFASAGAVNRTLNTLQKAFLLRTCRDSVYENRSRPCMLHQIKRCSAPCVGYIDLADYAKLVEDARAFLDGRSGELRQRLQGEMDEAAAGLDFERAARLRDRIRALAPITTAQGINPEGVEEADVVAVHMEGGQACVQAFFFRAGQNWGDRAFFPRVEKETGPEEVLAAFLGQFYDDKPAPRLILLSHAPADAELLEEALSQRAGRRVRLLAPKRGEKAKLVAQARSNAKEALGRRMAETGAQTKLLAAVAEAFDLEAPPRRIEVYDNSHIQGAKAVGAMIVAGPEGFEKGQYRTFNIKTADLAPGDDYAMMREVLKRRFARLLKDDASPPSGEGEEGGERRGKAGEPVENANPDGSAPSPDDAAPRTPPPPQAGEGGKWPDLVLIDGGRGQLSAVLDTLAELGLGPDDVDLVAIAKGPDRDAGRETYHRPGRPEMQLPPTSPVAHFLQRLRDEAHRFAIGTHRGRRKADIARNPLDEIAGVGPRRKKALLAHFGSAKGVSRAGLADLEAVEGVSKQLARAIFDRFRE